MNLTQAQSNSIYEFKYWVRLSLSSNRLKDWVQTMVSSNDGERIQPIDSIKTYAHGTSKDIVCKKKEIKCYNIIR